MANKTHNKNQNQTFSLNKKEISVRRSVGLDSDGLLISSSSLSLGENALKLEESLPSNMIDVSTKNLLLTDSQSSSSKFTISSANGQNLKLRQLGQAGKAGVTVKPVSTELNPNVFLDFWNVNFDKNFLAFNFSSDSFSDLSVGSSVTSWTDQITGQSLTGAGKVVEAYGQKFLKLNNKTAFSTGSFKLRNVLNPSFGILVFAVADTDENKTTNQVLSSTRKILQFLDNFNYEIKESVTTFVQPEDQEVPYMDDRGREMEKYKITIKFYTQTYKVEVDERDEDTNNVYDISWSEATSEKRVFYYSNSEKYIEDQRKDPLSEDYKYAASKSDAKSDAKLKFVSESYAFLSIRSTFSVATRLRVIRQPGDGIMPRIQDYFGTRYRQYVRGYALEAIDEEITKYPAETYTLEIPGKNITTTTTETRPSSSIYQTNFANIQNSSEINTAHFITSTLNTLRWASRAGGGRGPVVDFTIHQTASKNNIHFYGGMFARETKFPEDLTNSASNLNTPLEQTDFVINEGSGNVTYKKFKLFFVQMHTDSVPEDVEFVNKSVEIQYSNFRSFPYGLGLVGQELNDVYREAWEDLGFGQDAFYPKEFIQNLDEVITKVEFNTIVNGKPANTSYYRLQQSADLYKQDGLLMVAHAENLGKGNFVDYAISVGQNDQSVQDSSEIFLMDYFYGYEQTAEKRNKRSNFLLEHLAYRYKNLIFKTSDDDFQISNSANSLRFKMPSAHPFIRIHAEGE